MGLRKILKLFFYLLFRPKEFIKISDDTIAAPDRASRQHSVNDEKYQTTNKIRKAIWHSFLIVVGCFFLSLIFTFFIDLPYQFSPWLVLIGTGIILWATLGGFWLGWEIQSWSGNTLPEQMAKTYLKILYFFGTALIFTGILCEFIK